MSTVPLAMPLELICSCTRPPQLNEEVCEWEVGGGRARSDYGPMLIVEKKEAAREKGKEACDCLIQFSRSVNAPPTLTFQLLHPPWLRLLQQIHMRNSSEYFSP